MIKMACVDITGQKEKSNFNLKAKHKGCYNKAINNY